MKFNRSQRPLLIALAVIIFIIGAWAAAFALNLPALKCGDRSTFAYYKCKYSTASYDKDGACHKEYAMYSKESSLAGGPCPGDPQ